MAWKGSGNCQASTLWSPFDPAPNPREAGQGQKAAGDTTFSSSRGPFVGRTTGGTQPGRMPLPPALSHSRFGRVPSGTGKCRQGAVLSSIVNEFFLRTEFSARGGTGRGHGNRPLTLQANTRWKRGIGHGSGLVYPICRAREHLTEFSRMGRPPRDDSFLGSGATILEA